MALKLSRGGRFLHVSGGSGKGRAVRILLALLRCDRGPLRSVGLGDSPNDLPMLQAVDLPIIVPKPDLQPDPVLVELLPNHWTAPLPGPAGWNDAVLNGLERYVE